MTGTLTANRMAVRRLWTDADAYDSAKAGSGPLQEALHGILEFAVLASHRRAFDPKETAIGEAGRRLLAGTEHLHGDWTLVDDYPLSREMLAMSRVWQSPDRKAQMIAAKGAPEAIVDLCPMDATRQAAIAAQVATMADDGLRVLGVARATFATGELPDKQHDFDFEFLGLIALEDPVRPDVPRAITECRAAGIRVVMITGDHPATAMSIARQTGLTAVARAMTFSVLVMSNLGLIFANRFWNQSALLARGGSNHAFIWTAVATVAVLGAILGIPVLSGLFSHATPSLAMLLAGLGAAALSLLWFEGVQWGLGRRAAQAELQRRPTNDGAKSM